MKNYCCQLLSVREVNDIRQSEVPTAELLVPESGSFEVNIVVEPLKRYKSAGIGPVPA